MLTWWLKTPRVQALAIAWTLFITIASLTPGSELPKLELPGFDKLIHIILYIPVSLLWLRSFSSKESRQTSVIVFLAAVLLGIGIEWMQGNWVQGRRADGFDAIANALGAALGIVISKKID